MSEGESTVSRVSATQWQECGALGAPRIRLQFDDLRRRVDAVRAHAVDQAHWAASICATSVLLSGNLIDQFPNMWRLIPQ